MNASPLPTSTDHITPETHPEASRANVSNRPATKTTLLKTAGLIAGITLLSKLTGAFRDWQIMHFYGAGDATDAYFAAFQLPSFALILLGGLGGPFHTATVSLYQRWRNEIGETEARSRIGTFLTLTHWVFLALSIGVFLSAESLVRWVIAKPALVPIAAYHLQVMAPILWLGGMIGILYAWGNLHQRFFWPSFAPALVNLTLIASLYFFPIDPQGNILAWTTTLGATLQLLVQLPDAFKDKLPFRFTLPPEHQKQWWHPQGTFGVLWGLLLPAMVGTTIGQLITYVDITFATALPSGNWAALTLANRLMQLPIGVLQTALLVPLFPQLAQAASEEAFPHIKKLVRQGVVGLWVVCIPILIIAWFDGEALIRLIFERGAFDTHDTALVTTALVFQAAQMLPYFARDTFVRVCYAFQNAKTPLMIGLVAIGMKWLLNGWLSQSTFLGWPGLGLGVGGIALATSGITLLNMTLLSVVIQKYHIPDWSLRGLLGKPFLQLLPAFIGMALWMALVHSGPFTSLTGVSLHGALSLQGWGWLCLTWLVGLGIYGLLVYGFQLEEAQWVYQKVLSKYRKGASS
jgi:putative peptidoglycan lipid II flippase